jgi:hypothetical protein
VSFKDVSIVKFFHSKVVEQAFNLPFLVIFLGRTLLCFFKVFKAVLSTSTGNIPLGKNLVPHHVLLSQPSQRKLLIPQAYVSQTSRGPSDPSLIETTWAANIRKGFSRSPGVIFKWTS